MLISTMPYLKHFIAKAVSTSTKFRFLSLTQSGKPLELETLDIFRIWSTWRLAGDFLFHQQISGKQRSFWSVTILGFALMVQACS